MTEEIKKEKLDIDKKYIEDLKTIIDSKSPKIIGDTLDTLKEFLKEVYNNKDINDNIIICLINLIEFYNERNLNYNSLTSKIYSSKEIKEYYENELINYYIKEINNSINNTLNKNEISKNVLSYLSLYRFKYQNNKTTYVGKLSKLYSCIKNKNTLYNLYKEEIESLNDTLNQYQDELKNNYEKFKSLNNKLSENNKKKKKDINQLKRYSASFMVLLGILSCAKVGANKIVKPTYNYSSTTITDKNDIINRIYGDKGNPDNYLILREYFSDKNEIKKYQIPIDKEYSIDELRKIIEEPFENYLEYLTEDYISSIAEKENCKEITYIANEGRNLLIEKFDNILAFLTFSFIPVVLTFIRIDNKSYIKEITRIIKELNTLLDTNKTINENIESINDCIEKTYDLLEKVYRDVYKLKNDDILSILDTKEELIKQLDSLEKDSVKTLSKKYRK